MKRIRPKPRILLAVLACGLLVTAAAPQLKEALKVLGVGAAITQFGPEINRALNSLTKHKDTPQAATKVVPILTLGGRGAIGGAQVMGAKTNVDKVRAVLQLETTFLGEFTIRAMIPVSSDRDLSNPRRVNGVGVSGLLDLRL